MPLTYDDEPGSWGRASTCWPAVQLCGEDAAKRAFIACSKGALIPYGSYVMVDNSIRCETQELADRLRIYLAETPHKTYAEAKEHYKSIGVWER